MKKAEERLRKMHHIVWIIAGLILIIVLIIALRLFMDISDFFP